MNRIPFVKVSGSHFECGYQIGREYKEIIKKYIESCAQAPPNGLLWSDCIKEAEKYLSPTLDRYPFIVEEMKGAAKGAGVDFIDLFTSEIEELYASNYKVKACTDIISLPPASEHTFVAHNNDLVPHMKEMLTSVEWNFDNGTKMYTVGLAGVFVSVGVNNSGLVLSGNELTPNDNKIGVPRAYIARAILSANNFDDALKIATDPNRASSYNNIITISGKSVGIEASGTEFDILYPENGILVHSNHYCSEKMAKFECRPNYVSSISRLNSAKKQLENKKVGIDTLKEVLKSHGENGIPSDSTICRHDDESTTLFGFIVNVEKGEVELCWGKPCESEFHQVWSF